MGLEEYKPAEMSARATLVSKKASRASGGTDTALLRPKTGFTSQSARARRQDSIKPRNKRRKRDKAGSPLIAESQPVAGARADADSLQEQEQGGEPVSFAGAQTDVTAWGGLFLEPRLLQCLAGMGFGTPTPIQQDCLPPAIRDRRDIIGAAQTVSIFRSTHWLPARLV